jgi:hypothetical protein
MTQLRNCSIFKLSYFFRPRSTMDSIRASEAPDAGSIPAEATKEVVLLRPFYFLLNNYFSLIALSLKSFQ